MRAHSHDASPPTLWGELLIHIVFYCGTTTVLLCNTEEPFSPSTLCGVVSVARGQYLTHPELRAELRGAYAGQWFVAAGGARFPYTPLAHEACTYRGNTMRSAQGNLELSLRAGGNERLHLMLSAHGAASALEVKLGRTKPFLSPVGGETKTLAPLSHPHLTKLRVWGIARARQEGRGVA